MTRLIVAGAGLIGVRHIRHIADHPALTLAGVIDPVAKPEAACGAPLFSDVAHVDVPCDGLVIAAPTAAHAPLAAEAARRGWPVLVEKPLAGSLEAADALITATRGAGVPVLVGHHRRHHPRVAKLKALLADGAIGQPMVASLLWCMRKPDDYFAVPWRSGMDGAPVRMNLIHDIDLLRWLFGEVVDVAGAGGAPIRGAARTESGGAVLTFDSGVVATIAFADTAPTPWGFEAGTGENPNIAFTGQDALRIAGTSGAVEFPSLRVWSGAAHWGEAPTPRETPVEEAAPLVRQLEHFADVIHGRAAPLIDAEDGRRTLAATLAVEAATLPPQTALRAVV